MTKKTRTHILWAALLLFFLAAPPVLLYANGWRITSDFSLKRVGGIFISAGTTGAEIYIDGDFQKKTNILQQGLFMQGLTPDKISIIVAKEGYWPWAKDLEVKESFVTEARAFLVPQDITGNTILEGKYSNIYEVPGEKILMLEKKSTNDFSYDFFIPQERRLITVVRGISALSSSVPFKTFEEDGGDLYLIFPSKTVHVQFDMTSGTATADITANRAIDGSLPSFPHKILIDSHEQSRIWLSRDNTEIRAEWTQEPPLPYYFIEKETTIFSSPHIIRSFDFYGSRRDVILFAVENNIFAIELDGRSTRNFQPLYKGREPRFVSIGNIIYILEGNFLLEAKL